MELCKQPESLCIALKMVKVACHLRRKELVYLLTLELYLRQICPEPFTDIILAEVTERGIADVMDKSRTFKHTAGVALHLGSDDLSAVSHKVLEDHMAQ